MLNKFSTAVRTSMIRERERERETETEREREREKERDRERQRDVTCVVWGQSVM